jgi:hypothetical protein
MGYGDSTNVQVSFFPLSLLVNSLEKSFVFCFFNKQICAIPVAQFS